MTLYSSNRTFFVFSYQISHGLLLLRSGKSDQFPQRIDILFQDVVALELRTMNLGKLVINEESVDFLKQRSSNPADTIDPGHKVYSLNCDGWTGYVVGGVVSVHEDEKDLFEPSFLLTEHS